LIEGKRMMIHEQFRKCVSFLLVDTVDKETRTPKREPAATAFFVAALLRMTV